jgi:integrase
VTVAEVMLDWWEGQLKRYGIDDPKGRLPSHLYSHRALVRMVRATCGAIPAADFGPKALQDLRQQMVDKGWSRGHVNDSVAVIIRAFKQAVAAEVVKPEAVVALECVKPLKRGELGVSEGEKVKGVAIADVEAVKPYLSRQVVAIIDTMLLTGARCDEVVRMRPIDLDTTGQVWTYRPDGHKSEHHGRDRLIHIGPKAQAVIEPYLAGRGTHTPLFSPADAEAERRQKQHEQRQTPEKYGNKPGSNRKANPAKQPRQQYDTAAVRRAITRACDKASVSRWTPHQLRHTAATEIRRAAGVEAAALVLGHASATLTDAVYAERDHAKAAEVIARVG